MSATADAEVGPFTRALQGMRLRAGAPALVASAVVWLVLVVNFSALYLAGGDSSVQYRFVQRLFGDAPDALGYYFGLGLAEAPFYALGKLLGSVGIPAVAGHPVEQAVIALGLGLLTLAAWPLLDSVLRSLRVGHSGFAILAAAVGTPLFFYATFQPGKDHALDALLFTITIYLVLRYLQAGATESRLPFLIGGLVGLSCTVRYFNGAEAIALVLLLAYWRRWRDALTIAATATLVGLALFAVPWALGVPVFGGGYSAENVLSFAPLNPVRMLLSDHRGYLVWSPVAILAALGYVPLCRRRPEHRRFLVAVLAMTLAIVASYSLVAFWDGTWAFGQRFFTPLFPVVAIGLAGLLDAVPRPATAAAVAAVAWTLFLCFNLVTIGGPQYLDTVPDGASDLALVPIRDHTSLGAYGFGLWRASNLLRPVAAWPFSR
jgi:hypothetical protein